MKTLDILRCLVRCAENDAPDQQLGAFVAEHAVELAPELGTTPENLRLADVREDREVARVIRARLKACADVARDSKGEKATLLAASAAAKLGESVTWDEYRGAMLDVALLLGDVLADKSLAFVEFVDPNGYHEPVAISRALLTRASVVLRKRDDVRAYVDGEGLHFRFGRAGYNFRDARLTPNDRRDGILPIALAARPPRVETLTTPSPVVAVAAAYADAPAVIVAKPRRVVPASVVKTFFPRGARVLIDGKVRATVREVFPEGSTTYAFPHYCLDDALGNKLAVVNVVRVSVEVAKPKCIFCAREASTCWAMPCLDLQTALDNHDEETLTGWGDRAGIVVTKNGEVTEVVERFGVSRQDKDGRDVPHRSAEGRTIRRCVSPDRTVLAWGSTFDVPATFAAGRKLVLRVSSHNPASVDVVDPATKATIATLTRAA